jgi:hypothetical protein
MSKNSDDAWFSSPSVQLMINNEGIYRRLTGKTLMISRSREQSSKMRYFLKDVVRQNEISASIQHVFNNILFEIIGQITQRSTFKYNHAWRA